MDEERKNCLAAAMNDYLNKPVRRSRIAAKIDDCHDAMATMA